MAIEFPVGDNGFIAYGVLQENKVVNITIRSKGANNFLATLWILGPGKEEVDLVYTGSHVSAGLLYQGKRQFKFGQTVKAELKYQRTDIQNAPWEDIFIIGSNGHLWFEHEHGHSIQGSDGGKQDDNLEIAFEW